MNERNQPLGASLPVLTTKPSSPQTNSSLAQTIHGEVTYSPIKQRPGTSPSSVHSTPRSVRTRSKYFSKKLKKLSHFESLAPGKKPGAKGSMIGSLTQTRNRICAENLDSLDLKYSGTSGHHTTMSAAALHQWKIDGERYEKAMYQTTLILNWIRDVRTGKATEDDMPVFREDIEGLFGDDRPTSRSGKSRLTQEAKPSFHVKDQFWDGKSTMRVKNKLDFYRGPDNRWILEKRIKQFQQEEREAMAAKYGEEATILESKIEKNKLIAFKLTKKYWQARREANRKNREKLTSTARILKQAEDRKRRAKKMKTYNKRRNKKLSEKEMARKKRLQKKWIKYITLGRTGMAIRNLQHFARSERFRILRESRAQQCIARNWRVHHGETTERKQNNAQIQIGRVMRGFLARKRIRWQRAAAVLLQDHFHSVGKLAKLQRCIDMRHRAATTIKHAWLHRLEKLKEELEEMNERLADVADQRGGDATKIQPEIRDDVLKEILREKRIAWKDTTFAKYAFDFKTYNAKLNRLRTQSKEDPTARALIYMIKRPVKPTFIIEVPDKEIRKALKTCMYLKKNPKRWRARQLKAQEWIASQYEKTSSTGKNTSEASVEEHAPRKKLSRKSSTKLKSPKKSKRKSLKKK
jgi:hypothetical protein